MTDETDDAAQLNSLKANEKSDDGGKSFFTRSKMAIEWKIPEATRDADEQS